MLQTQSPTKGQGGSLEEVKTTTRRHVTLEAMAARLRGRSRTELIFGAALVVLALHLAVLAIEGRSIFGSMKETCDGFVRESLRM
jgi:hypothetical protein